MWASRWIMMAFTLSLALSTGGRATAQARTDYLIRLLAQSDAFRVRAQAAISLGRVEADPRIVGALSEALDDSHPAVRTAAAASLERLSDPSALDALRERRNDRDRAVRRAIRSALSALQRIARTQPQTEEPDERSNASARYYVGVGIPGTKQARLDRSALRAAREVLVAQVRQLDDVQVAPESESRTAASRVLREQNLTGYYLDSSIVSVDETGAGTRAVVSVIVGTYPGRDMRAILQGAATVPGAGGADARKAAIEGALRGALRRLPQAMQASANR